MIRTLDLEGGSYRKFGIPAAAGDQVVVPVIAIDHPGQVPGLVIGVGDALHRVASPSTLWARPTMPANVVGTHAHFCGENGTIAKMIRLPKLQLTHRTTVLHDG